MKENIKRVFLIVLDSFGIGEAPDAEAFGDAGADTLGAVVKSKKFNAPNLTKLGLFAIEGQKEKAPTEAVSNISGAVARLRELSKPVFFINLSSMLINEFAPDDYDGDITNYSELFSFIESMPIPADEKFELCRLYNGFETYKSLLADILEDAGSLFAEKYDVVKHYIGWFITAINEPLEKGGQKFVEENYGIEVSPSVDVLYLQPSIVMCNTTRYLMSFTDERVYDFFYIGVLFEPLREITDSSTLEDKLCRNLRTIGDQRNFEILHLLAESPKYGQQLASLLDISTATVSHHMALLMECGFVEIKRESNRIYYCLNRKKIRDFVDELSESLLN